jgi:hypothetical protein
MKAKRCFLSMLLLSLSILTLGQTEDTTLNGMFNLKVSPPSDSLYVLDTLVSDSLFKAIKSHLKYREPDSILYEDDKYIVKGTCSGEYGGSIWFRNRQTGVVRSCSGTCPVAVDKIDGKYIVSCSLAHLLGTSEVIEIDDPDSLDIFRKPKPYKVKGKVKLYYLGDSESKSGKGTKKILDTVRAMIIGALPYQGKMLYVVAGGGATFLARLTDEGLIHTQLLARFNLWGYEPVVKMTADGKSYVMFCQNDHVAGLIIISGSIAIVLRHPASPVEKDRPGDRVLL